MTRLLLIEDNHVLSVVEARQLEAAFSGVAVTAVTDGAGARSYLETAAPDVVVMDCNLPDCGCEELLREIRERAPEARILITSAATPQRLRAACDKGDLFGVLDKPYELEELVESVRQAIGATGSSRSGIVGSTAVEVVDGFDRHKTLNYLSGLMAGLRAFEADLRADAGERGAVLADVEEYVPRLIGTVRDLTIAVKSINMETERRG